MIGSRGGLAAVGDQVAHRREAGGPDVSGPGDLHRRRLSAENGEPVARRVARQVNQDVDAVFADQVCQLIVSHAENGLPRVAVAPQPVGQIVTETLVGITVNPEARTVMGRQNPVKEIADGMAAQVAGNVTDPQRPFRFGSVCRRGHHPDSRQMGRFPRPGLAQQIFRRDRGVVLEVHEQVAVGDHMIRLQLQSTPVACHGIRDAALVLEYRPQVVVCFRHVRPDRERPGVCADRFLRVAQLFPGVAEVDEHFGVVRFPFQCLAVHGNGLGGLAVVTQSVPQVHQEARRPRFEGRCPAVA